MSDSGLREGKLYVISDYKWVHAIVALVAAPIIVSLLCCHGCRYIRDKRRNNESRNGLNCLINWFVFSSLITAVVDLGFSIIVYFHISVLNCQILNFIMGVSFAYIQDCLYFIAANATSIIFPGDAITVYNEVHDYYWCQYALKLEIGFAVAAYDIMINITLLILFIKPLIQLTNAQPSEQNNKTVGLVVKYLILLLTGVITTALSRTLLFFGIASILILDIGINLLCILLMSPLHIQYYFCFCKICHNRLENMWLKRLKRKNINAVNIQKSAQLSGNINVNNKCGEPTAMTIKSGLNSDIILTATQNEGRTLPGNNDIQDEYITDGNVNDMSFTSKIMERNDSIIQKHLAANQYIINKETRGQFIDDPIWIETPL